jgi:rod shape determining protein RodA
MAAVFDKPSLWQRSTPMLRGLTGRWPLPCSCWPAGLLTMYSSGFDHGTRFVDHGRNMLIAAPSCSWWRRCRRSG